MTANTHIGTIHSLCGDLLRERPVEAGVDPSFEIVANDAQGGLYDQAFEYVDRPTELEAYRYTIDEARRMGMNEDEILRYLRVDSVDDSELGKLMEKIGVRARR